MALSLTSILKSGPLLLLGLACTLGAQAQVIGGQSIDPGSAVAVVVKVPKPWYASTFMVVNRMRATVSQYQALPGLAYKAFSLAQADGQYGGLYLWKDEASARAWFNSAWFERVERERGAKGNVQFYEVPVAIDNTPGVTVNDGQAVATVVTVATPKGVSKAQLVQEFRAAIPAYRKIPGLMRKHFIVTDDGRFGGIYVWRDAASAQRWFNDAWKDRVVNTYGSPAAVEWFDVPILLSSTTAGNQPSIPGL